MYQTEGRRRKADQTKGFASSAFPDPFKFPLKPRFYVEISNRRRSSIAHWQNIPVHCDLILIKRSAAELALPSIRILKEARR